MSLMKNLLQHNQPIWDACIATPFLRKLAGGDLPPAHFAGYMLQDAIYLTHYARSVGSAVACANELAEMQLFSELLRAVTSDELRVRFAVLNDYGLSAADIAKAAPLPACKAYLDFLDQACAMRDQRVLLMALLPCMLSYSYIFRKLASDPTSRASTYWPFIRDYADTTFADDCARWQTFADQRCQNLPLREQQRLAARFTRASQLELRFWLMADHPLGGSRHD